MEFIRGLLMVVEVLCAFLLIIIILMQKSKSQGVGMAFGGQMGESLFGSQMGNVLTKATVILAVVFLLNTLLLARLGPRVGEGKSAAEELGKAKPAPVEASNSQGAPASGGAAQGGNTPATE